MSELPETLERKAARVRPFWLELLHALGATAFLILFAVGLTHFGNSLHN